jgi:hypothetical protein
MDCEGWMIESDRLTDHGVTCTYELRSLSLKIHVVVFRFMALCIVVHCYAAWTLREYSLPKCWYPLIKLRCIDTIEYLQFLSHVTFLIS